MASDTKKFTPLIFAAPLCGYTRYPYREILRMFPYDRLFTEMVSVDAIAYNNPLTEQIYHAPLGQTNLGVQLFGSKVEHFLYSVEHLSGFGRFCAFDINCGCPVPKVLKSGGGSALLQSPELIYRIIHSLTSEFPQLEITAKIRLGINKNHQPYLEVARAIQEGGAKLITVHGRNQNQRYDGEVDLSAIAEIKNILTIPVIGNGGVFSPEDAKKMIDATGVDGVMVARGLIGTPWIARQIKDFFETGSYIQPSDTEKLEILKKHFYEEQQFEPQNGFREFKKIGVAYLKGIQNSKHWKIALSLAASSQEMGNIIHELEIDILSRPLNGPTV